MPRRTHSGSWTVTRLGALVAIVGCTDPDLALQDRTLEPRRMLNTHEQTNSGPYAATGCKPNGYLIGGECDCTSGEIATARRGHYRDNPEVIWICECSPNSNLPLSEGMLLLQTTAIAYCWE